MDVLGDLVKVDEDTVVLNLDDSVVLELLVEGDAVDLETEFVVDDDFTVVDANHRITINL